MGEDIPDVSRRLTWLSVLTVARRQIAGFMMPIILLPLPLFFQTKAAYCGYVVLIMAYYWIVSTVPMAVTALIPMVAYPLLGIETADNLSGVYLTDTNFVFFGSLLMAMGVESTKLHERVALHILMFTGSNPRWLMLGFQISTAMLSMWISNTATTAMMLPIVISVICELEYCKQKHKCPNDIIIMQDQKTLNFSKSASRDRNIYKGLLLSICFSASIGGIGTIIGTGPNLIMSAFLEQEFDGRSPITFAKWMIFAVPQLVCMIIFSWFWLQFLFIGFDCNSDDLEVEKVIRNVLRRKHESLGPMKFSEKTVCMLFITMFMLWFFRHPKVIPGWGELFLPGYVTDSTVSLGIGILLFILPAENPFNLKRYSSVDAEGKWIEFKPILKWTDMHERFSWGTLLLLGGGCAMAKGVETSKLSDIVGGYLSTLGDLPNWAFILLSCILITMLTEFSSNIATASIFIPIVASVANSHETNPLFYVLPSTISCSFAFMFPAGTPPNAIVFSAGLLKVHDMIKAGFILNFFGLLMIFAAMHTYAVPLFDLHFIQHHVINGNTTIIH